MANLKELLLVQLECKICYNYMKPPIILCSKGHNCCKDCVNKYTTCVICKYPFLTTRNLALEELATEVDLKCEYCGFVANCILMDDHKRNCKENRFKNQFYKCEKQIIGKNLLKSCCKWSGCLDDVYKHFKENHDKSVYDMDLGIAKKFVWKLPYKQDQIDIQIINVENVHFLCYIFYDFMIKKMYFIIINCNNNNIKYNFEIHINNGDDRLKWEQDITDECKSLKELIHENNCIKIKIEDFMNFKDFERHVSWTLIINKNFD